MTPDSNPRKARFALPLVLSALAGCATNAAIVPLDEPAGEALVAFSAETLPPDPIPAAWWTGFDDPLLSALVERSLLHSPALTIADLNVAVAEAELRRLGLNRTPDVTSQTSADFSEPAGRTEDPEWAARGSVGASWEYDAFGRIRALIENAEASADTIIELRRDIAVTVASETALAYIDLRGAQRRLSVARQNAESQAEGLDLIQTLLNNGRASQLDVDRAETIYRTTLASIPVFQADIDQAIFQLAALTGEPATQATTAFRALLTDDDGSIPELVGPLSTGTPGDMIRRRPDIRLAEADLGGALALTAAARANLFPQIVVNGSVSALFRPEGVFGSESGLNLGFSVGPTISWAGPDLRRIRADIDAADGRAMVAAATYEQAVINALLDVEVSLSNYVNERSRRTDLVAAAVAADRALELATLRYQEGLDDYLDVLDAQRTRLDAEDRLAVSRLETARGAVQAYRSLGGIWDDETLMAQRAG
ncbi:MAG: TolC family protein [Pseudomonadota bacterium]